ncbi:MAG TPA: AAA family ATPase [Allosphingosinicella sp.]|jgi:energy-coupling factor transporter ATP-binding protein EcfA2
MRVQTIEFRAGKAQGTSPLKLLPGTITVFIGPNNGGKSKGLRELSHLIAPSGHLDPVVLSSCSLSPLQEDEFQRKFNRLLQPKTPGEGADPNTQPIVRRGKRTVVNVSYLRQGAFGNGDVNARQYAAENFLKHFVMNLSGAGRLELANPAPAQALGTSHPSTIGALFQNDAVRAQLSTVTHEAFNQYLVIDPTGMTQLAYRLSDHQPAAGVERSLTNEAVNFFNQAMPLVEASDGTKAFVGVMGEILSGDSDVILIDEPEAFLHPSLAYLLGDRIARHLAADKQLFAATHSSHFLMGCLMSGSDVNVVRLTHRNGASTARILPADRLKTLMTDPLFRSVGVVSALFFESAVVVEGDSDRAFYDEINSRLQRSTVGGLSHSIFLNAHNKQTVVNIVVPLREIGIPAAFILDLDWVKEDGQVWDRYFSALGAPAGLKEGLLATRRRVRLALEAADPNYKRHGGIGILQGEERATAEAFFGQLEQYGLFTVTSGELESWLPTLVADRSKNKWLPSVFAALGSDPAANDYVQPGNDDVWAFMGRIRAWVTNPLRLGMGF